MSGYDLSIVLPVYEDQKNLDRFLDEMLANPQDKNWEVIVVDDGSPEALHLAPNLPNHWKIFRNQTRKGAASARNFGIKQAEGEYIALLSVFLRIPDSYISQVLEYIKTHDFDVAQHPVKKSTESKANHFQEFLTNQTGRLSKMDNNLPVKNTQFGAAIVKKEIFLKVDGFDEHMNHYGGHELDLAYRLDQEGYSRRILINDLPLERIKMETHARVRSRLQEYGRIGLPALLKKHPQLKNTILLYPAVWSPLKLLGVPKRMEKRLKDRIEQDVALSKRQYRMYLHLLVRNAWDAR